MDDYEQKYKKALGWMQSLYNGLHGATKEDAEHYFPELAESEDERIKKALVRFHKSTIDIDGIKGADILAWLEKQGKTATIDIDRMVLKYSQTREACTNGLPINCQIRAYRQGINDVLNLSLNLEKQCEQPSAIRWYDVSLIPQEMEELLVEWDSEDATWHEIAFYHADTKTFWNGTRQVENVTRWCYIIDLLEKQGEQKVSVVDFNAKDWYVSKVDGKIHDMTYNPADKVEPRFKVKYAGSEYNVLEVKDIAGVTFYGIEDEPNHIDYVKAENCEIISGYAIKENGSPYPTKPAVFSEKKPTAWSEEDDYNLQCMIAKVTSDIQKGNVGRNNELIDWLKSIKERVQPQPKQEWSEEDEKMAEDLIKGCVSAEKAHHFLHIPKEVADWLKSLKDRIICKNTI